MSQRKRLKTKGARGEESDKYIKWANEDVRERDSNRVRDS